MVPADVQRAHFVKPDDPPAALRGTVISFSSSFRSNTDTLVPTHCDTAIARATNLSGYRANISDCESIGPRDVVFEPTGNVDMRRYHDDAPCNIQSPIAGRLKYVGYDGICILPTSWLHEGGCLTAKLTQQKLLQGRSIARRQLDHVACLASEPLQESRRARSGRGSSG